MRTTIAEASETNPRNDSASLVELSDGSLFLVWMEFTESELKGGDEALNHIASMTSSDGGASWGIKRIEAESPPGDISVYNPSLLRLQDRSILFHYFAYNKLEWQTPLESTGYLLRSNDECASFSESTTDWSHEPYHHASNTYIQLRSGRIIHALGKIGIWGGPNDNQVAASRYSDDNGESWHLSQNEVVLPLRGAMEPHLAEGKNDHLLMVVRTQLGGPFGAHSTNGGESWSKPQMLGVTGAESMPVIASMPDSEDLLLIWNNSKYDPKFDHFGKRTPLQSAISKDDGKSWQKGSAIESNPSWEYSNPSINVLSNNRIAVTYFASKMENPNPPGKCGRSRMSLHGFFADTDWFYSTP